jgi:hypothetical protein
VHDTQAFRVRRYPVGRPVEQEVTLRDETVTIERHTPITSTSAPSTDQPFEDKTVEVTRTREEPVVAKTVVKGDDVVVKKETAERRQRYGTRCERLRSRPARAKRSLADPREPFSRGGLFFGALCRSRRTAAAHPDDSAGAARGDERGIGTSMQRGRAGGRSITPLAEA